MTELQTNQSSRRLMSLDAYRGFTMLLMVSGGLGLASIAGHFPDSWVWSQLSYHTRHAHWLGCSLWDLIQPSFMFLVGVSMAYSYAIRKERGQTYPQMFRHAAKRALILILLGVFLRSNSRGKTYWTFEDVISQIGLGYIFLFMLWRRSWKTQLSAALLILLGYWCLFAIYPLPSSDFDYATVGVDAKMQTSEHFLSGFEAHWNRGSNAANAFDVWFLNLFPREHPFVAHEYNTLNFIPSLATMIFGLLAGGVLRSDRTDQQKFKTLFIAGLIGLASGWILDALGVCPIVKKAWTPTWTLFSSGCALLFLAGFFWIIDCKNYRRWAFPGVVVGMNSIAIYVMNGLIAGWILSTFYIHIYFILGRDYAEWLAPYKSLVERIIPLTALFLICLWMYRRKIFLRI